jgi:hypothetical protein
MLVLSALIGVTGYRVCWLDTVAVGALDVADEALLIVVEVTVDALLVVVKVAIEADVDTFGGKVELLWIDTDVDSVVTKVEAEEKLVGIEPLVVILELIAVGTTGVEQAETTNAAF